VGVLHATKIWLVDWGERWRGISERDSWASSSSPSFRVLVTLEKE
jgi:hypothetical protein